MKLHDTKLPPADTIARDYGKRGVRKSTSCGTALTNRGMTSKHRESDLKAVVFSRDFDGKDRALSVAQLRSKTRVNFNKLHFLISLKQVKVRIL